MSDLVQIPAYGFDELSEEPVSGGLGYAIEVRRDEPHLRFREGDLLIVKPQDRYNCDSHYLLRSDDFAIVQGGMSDKFPIGWVTRADGLRKAGATRLAEAGATELQIMAFLAHASPKEGATYTKKAGRAALADAGLAKIAGMKSERNLSNPPKRLDKNGV